jgi:hypothetical protein
VAIADAHLSVDGSVAIKNEASIQLAPKPSPVFRMQDGLVPTAGCRRNNADELDRGAGRIQLRDVDDDSILRVCRCGDIVDLDSQGADGALWITHMRDMHCNAQKRRVRVAIVCNGARNPALRKGRLQGFNINGGWRVVNYETNRHIRFEANAVRAYDAHGGDSEWQRRVEQRTGAPSHMQPLTHITTARGIADGPPIARDAALRI